MTFQELIQTGVVRLTASLLYASFAVCVSIFMEMIHGAQPGLRGNVDKEFCPLRGVPKENLISRRA